MNLRKTSAFLFGLTLLGSAFAGSEDWNGIYKVKLDTNEVWDISHSPTSVQFSFLSVGKCASFAKGSRFNGYQFKEDVKLCVSSNAEQFTAEVQKIGSVESKLIRLGPTYTAE